MTDIVQRFAVATSRQICALKAEDCILRLDLSQGTGDPKGTELCSISLARRYSLAARI